MQFNRRDLSYLYDIHESATDIIRLTTKKDVNEFVNDKMTRAAVERCYSIIGTATDKLSKEAKDSLCNIQWDKIMEIKNVVTFDYRNIDGNEMWEFSRSHVPEIVRELEQIDELKEYITK